MEKFNLPDLYDACTWVGNWPFSTLRYHTLDTLKKKLMELGIKKALVSPLDAVFSHNPILSAQAVLDADRDFFIPAPVVDLSRENWTDMIEWPDIKVVKLLPNYHMYSLQETIGKLIQETQKRNVVISVQVRMQDPRGQYKLLKVDNTDSSELLSTVKKYPDQKFLLNGMYPGEIGKFTGLENVRIGTEALEGSDIYRTLVENYRSDRFVFSTHTPLFFPEGNVFKLAYASISDEQKKALGGENLKNFIE